MDSHRFALHAWDLFKLRTISHRKVFCTSMICTDGRGHRGRHARAGQRHEQISSEPENNLELCFRTHFSIPKTARFRGANLEHPLWVLQILLTKWCRSLALQSGTGEQALCKSSPDHHPSRRFVEICPRL